jgi:uncharacterized protein (DUF2147 family)
MVKIPRMSVPRALESDHLPKIAWPCIDTDSFKSKLRGRMTATVPAAAAAAATAADAADAAGDATLASSKRGDNTAVVATGRMGPEACVVLDWIPVIEYTPDVSIVP